MRQLLTVLCVLAMTAASAQTLFTYGKEAVSAEEFLAAYRKNNSHTKDEKALREYLELYIASRLKVREAKEQGFDTLPQLRTDLANLRQQILPSFLNDKESLDRLVKEALSRSQKDIHVAHIFIAYTKNGVYNPEAAAKRKDEVADKLAKGGKFEDLAKQYSDDPGALKNGGDIGWVTVFSLPYELENLVYTTPAGKTSEAYASKAGYHIFKNLGERKALGRMKASQILLAFPPGADDSYKASLKKTADSLYKRLQAGDDFGKLAAAFSNDVVTAASNGQMSEFGVGEYSPAFETAVFALAKDGAYTKPFVTDHGYHIVKRNKLVPAPAKADVAAMDNLQQKVESSDRMLVSRMVLAQNVVKQAGYKKLLSSDNELWMYSDSMFNVRRPSGKLSIQPTTSVLQIGAQEMQAKDWISFAQSARIRPGGGAKPYAQVWDEFVQASALQYYQDNLEDFNEAFRRQITEFAEGNLFFEIMQQKIWTPSQTDTAALFNYYQQHKEKYVWKPSAETVIFYAGDLDVAKAFHKALSQTPNDWRTVANNYSEQVTADSGRFELMQIPKKEKEVIRVGGVTSPLENKDDNTVSFAYIIKLYSKEEPRSFADAKALVINDYQVEMEKAWLAELKAKYPVKVDEKVWSEVVKKSK